MSLAFALIQGLHAILAAALCISVEWRKPGLILLGFALLYLTMQESGIDLWLRTADPSLFKLLCVALEMLCAMAIFSLCKPSRHNKSFTEFHRLGLTGILMVFWVAHYLNFNYTMGYTPAFDVDTYNWITLLAGLATIPLLWPGAKDGVYAAKKFNLGEMLDNLVPLPGTYSVSDYAIRSGKHSQRDSVLRGPLASLPLAHGAHEIHRGEEQ